MVFIVSLKLLVTKNHLVKMFIILSVLLSIISLVYGSRNENSESICRPFLVSQETAPLNPHNTRNLTIDEDGEYECELVLQDPTLPIQIRGTIHEGLSYLAVRHVQLGLRRHKDIIRHLDMMTKLAPKHFSFAYRAGYWRLESYVDEPEDAVKYLGV